MNAGACIPTGTLSVSATTVSGTVNLTATAAAESPATVASVQFRVDGTAIGAADTSAPYSVSWDTTTVSDGAHQLTAFVTDSMSRTNTSAAVSVTVANTQTFAVTLGPEQIYPAPASTASATGSLNINLSTGAASGSVTTSGVTATGVVIGDAYAGNTGSTLMTLTQVGTGSQWNLPAGATLNAAQLTDLAAGRLYVLAASAANPQGEVRGQITPANVTVRFITLSGAQEVPPVATSATGVAAVTVDATGLKASVHVHTTGLTSITGAQLQTGAAGAVGSTLAALVVDTNDANHYLSEAISISAADLSNFTGNNWYVNVYTAAHSGGEIRAQVAAPAPTLTQLKADIFAPRCSGCHTGGGMSLPASQNLAGTTAQIYASIVNVASEEQPGVLRIKSGDPDNSYLVRKIQGTAGISGAQMPLNGTPLTTAQINEVRAWVSAGALNN
jgi:mono/diheme cytochrome c family protein